MNTTKKIKSESLYDFNLLKELYLKKENRNILSEVIKYVRQKTRVIIAFIIKESIHNCFHSDICDNCYIYCESVNGLSCSSLSLHNNCEYYFCETCQLEHNRDHTIMLCGAIYKDSMVFTITHSCKFMSRLVTHIFMDTIYLTLPKENYVKGNEIIRTNDYFPYYQGFEPIVRKMLPDISSKIPGYVEKYKDLFEK